jgi:hypothetical protein
VKGNLGNLITIFLTEFHELKSNKIDFDHFTELKVKVGSER